MKQINWLGWATASILVLLVGAGLGLVHSAIGYQEQHMAAACPCQGGHPGAASQAAAGTVARVPEGRPIAATDAGAASIRPQSQAATSTTTSSTTQEG